MIPRTSPCSSARRVAALVALAWAGSAACSSDVPVEVETTRVTRMPATVGGCNCPSTGTCADLSYSDIPADGRYFVTTFGGGTDTQPMSCGGTADGTWAYSAGRARFPCGTKLLVTANSKQCVAEVRDCGPNRCVEEAACNCSCTGHSPILDVSPFVTQYLLGVSSAGWSERRPVTAVPVDATSTIGCPGVAVGGGGAGGASGTGGTSGTAGAGGTAGTGGTAGAGGTAGIGGTAGASGSGGTGAVSGTGGTAGAPSTCDTFPNCDGCGECLSRCVCELGDAVTCAGICAPPPVDAGGGSGGSAGSATGCSSAPDCGACVGCDARCLCETGSPTSCDAICGAASGGTGGSGFGGGGGLGSPGCSEPDCGSCDSCWAHCVCVTGEPEPCATGCGTGGAGGSATGGTGGSAASAAGPAATEKPLPAVSGGPCGCRAPGDRSSPHGALLALALAAAGLGRSRGGRARARDHWPRGSRDESVFNTHAQALE